MMRIQYAVNNAIKHYHPNIRTHISAVNPMLTMVVSFSGNHSGGRNNSTSDPWRGSSAAPSSARIPDPHTAWAAGGRAGDGGPEARGIGRVACGNGAGRSRSWGRFNQLRVAGANCTKMWRGRAKIKWAIFGIETGGGWYILCAPMVRGVA